MLRTLFSSLVPWRRSWRARRGRQALLRDLAGRPDHLFDDLGQERRHGRRAASVVAPLISAGPGTTPRPRP